MLQTGGSSSGIGTAANFWAGNVGSDTGGSIISPSNANMLVGIRPTIGRISRYGVIPITADHDTAGPMTKTVADAAIMLGAMEGASPDPNDAATRTCTPPPNRDYTKFLNAGGLKGARIGVPRAFYIDRVTLPGEKKPRGGINAEQAKVMADAIAVLKQQGAVDRRSGRHSELRGEDRERQLSAVGLLLRRRTRQGQGPELLDQLQVRHEARLQRVARVARPIGAGEVAEGAHRMEPSPMRKPARSNIGSRASTSQMKSIWPPTRRALDADDAKDRRLSRDQGIDGVLKAHKLDAFITPGGSGAGIAARAGYPIIAVPFAMVPNAPQQPFPAGFNAKPAPFGVGFVGAQCSEPKLIEIAYAFEQATKKRVPPASEP